LKFWNFPLSSNVKNKVRVFKIGIFQYLFPTLSQTNSLLSGVRITHQPRKILINPGVFWVRDLYGINHQPKKSWVDNLYGQKFKKIANKNVNKSLKFIQKWVDKFGSKNKRKNRFTNGRTFRL